MNDFRYYSGIDYSPFLIHYGVGHEKGGHSGRYPWGSGANPKQRFTPEKKTVKRSSAIREKARKSGFKVLNQPESQKEIISKVNPYRGKIGGADNCYSCSMSGFLMENGIEATARRVLRRGGIKAMQILDNTIKEPEKHYTDYTYDKGERPEAIIGAIKKDYGKTDSSGVIFIRWDTGGGHVFNWSTSGGKVSFIDYQTGGSTDNYFKHIDTNEQVTVYRLDDADIDFDKLSKYVRK